MRVIIEIIKGPNTGQRRLLTAGNQIVVGRSEFADISCSSDTQMSREHFRVTASDDSCLLEDLKSRNGTMLNAIPIDRATSLQDGDKITSGATVFNILLQGGKSVDFKETQPGSHRSSAPNASMKSSVVIDALKGLLRGQYSVQKCHSGLNQYSGNTEELPPADIAELLSRKHEPYLILDKNRAGVELPAMSAEAAVLFDFLPLEAAKSVSPVLIAGVDCPEWTSLIADTWGSDSLVIFYADGDKEKITGAIRSSVKPDRNGGVVGLCWPAVLDSLLTFDQSGTASGLVNLAEMIMIEAPDLPEQWHVYSKEDLRPAFNRFGLREAGITEQKTESSINRKAKE